MKLLSDPDGPFDLIPPQGGVLGTVTVRGSEVTVNLNALPKQGRLLSEIIGDRVLSSERYPSFITIKEDK